MKEGHGYYESADYDKAFICYQKSDRIEHTARRRLFMSRAQGKSKRYDEARELLQEVLADPSATPQDKEKAQRDLDGIDRVALRQPAEPVSPPQGAASLPQSAMPPSQPSRPIAQPSEPPPPPPPPPSPLRRNWTAPILFGVMGGVSLTVGIIAGGISWGKTSDLKDRCHMVPCSLVNTEAWNSAKLAAKTSDWAFAITGGLALATGISLGIIASQHLPSARGVGINHVRIGIKLHGLVMEGRF